MISDDFFKVMLEESMIRSYFVCVKKVVFWVNVYFSEFFFNVIIVYKFVILVFIVFFVFV